MINTQTHNVHFTSKKNLDFSRKETQVSEMNITSSQENNYSISSEEMLHGNSSNKKIQKQTTFQTDKGIFFQRQVCSEDQSISNSLNSGICTDQSKVQFTQQDPKLLVGQVKQLWNKFFKNYQRSLTMVLEQGDDFQSSFEEEEQNQEANLKLLLEQALQLSDIRMSQYQKLDNFDQIILSNFIQKKFKIKCHGKQNSEDVYLTQFQKSIKTKRNEEILKFVLKGFFKYLCKIKQKTCPKKNFFQLKKEISMSIFQEICEDINVNLDQFLSESFIDRKKLIIKGNKRIPIYTRSKTFSFHISNYLKNYFIHNYKKKRVDKINTIVLNVKQKFSVDNEKQINQVKEFFLKNPKLKLPWSDQELQNAQEYCLKIFRLKQFQ